MAVDRTRLETAIEELESGLERIGLGATPAVVVGIMAQRIVEEGRCLPAMSTLELTHLADQCCETLRRKQAEA